MLLHSLIINSLCLEAAIRELPRTLNGACGLTRNALNNQRRIAPAMVTLGMPTPGRYARISLRINRSLLLPRSRVGTLPAMLWKHCAGYLSQRARPLAISNGSQPSRCASAKQARGEVPSMQYPQMFAGAFAPEHTQYIPRLWQQRGMSYECLHSSYAASA